MAAPIVVNPYPDFNAVVGVPFRVDFDASRYFDPDPGGRIVAVSMLVLPVTGAVFTTINQSGIYDTGVGGTPVAAFIGSVNDVEFFVVDASSEAVSEFFRITVIANTAPVADSTVYAVYSEGSSVSENAGATDVDAAAGDTLAYSILAGNTDSTFAINSTTGEITLATGKKLDYETEDHYSLFVTITDLGGNSVIQTVFIDVHDVDAAGTSLTGTSQGNDKTVLSDADEIGNAQAGNDTIEGLGGDDELGGGTGNDRIYGDYRKNGSANPFGDDILQGGAGNDKIYGGFGNDQLFGDAGNDALQGEAGDDELTGGTGLDRLFGGSGADTFLFDDGDSGVAQRDRIGDFSHAEGDVIDLSAVDGDVATGGDDALVLYAGASAQADALANVGGVYVQSLGTLARVYINNDSATAGFDMVIEVSTATVLDGSDFVLA